MTKNSKDKLNIEQKTRVYAMRNMLFYALINFLVLLVVFTLIVVSVYFASNSITEKENCEKINFASSQSISNIGEIVKDGNIELEYFVLIYDSKGVRMDYCDYYKFGDKQKSLGKVGEAYSIIVNNEYCLAFTKQIVDSNSYDNYYVKIVMPIENPNFSILFTPARLGAISLIALLFIVITSLILAYFQSYASVKAVKMTNKFTSDVSHELNTPLSIIQSNLQNVLDEPTMSVSEVSGSLALSLNEVKRMKKMTKELLTLSRSDSNKLSVNIKEYNFKKVIEPIIEPYELMCEMQDKHFSCSYNIAGESVAFDLDIIIQIITALLDNAIKYTVENESVKVDFSTKNSLLLITISDTGQGIKEKDFDKIFTRFYRSESSRTTEGTGLGLSIVHALVVSLGGRIFAKNAKPSGFEVQVGIPIKRKSS